MLFRLQDFRENQAFRPHFRASAGLKYQHHLPVSQFSGIKNIPIYFKHGSPLPNVYRSNKNRDKEGRSGSTRLNIINIQLVKERHNPGDETNRCPIRG